MHLYVASQLVKVIDFLCIYYLKASLSLVQDLKN